MGSVSVEEFMAQNHQKKGRVSKLTPFKDDILLLKNNGYSQEQILDYLRQNGLVVGTTTLNSFIKKNNKTVITDAILPQVNNQQPKTEQKTPKKGIKKFQWTDANSDGLV